MRTGTRSTVLDAPADVVWAAAKAPHTFVYVAKGVLRFPAAERIDTYDVGDQISGWLLLFGVLPLSKHHITVESIDDATRTLQSDEHGDLIRSWRHRIRIEPLDERRCRYEDQIVIDAGPATVIVAAFASLFFCYRQRRLRPLARLLATVRAD